MNHNIGNKIIEKVQNLYNNDLINVIEAMSEATLYWYSGESIDDSRTKIIEYLKTVEYNEVLFRSLFIFLLNIDDRIDTTDGLKCNIDDMPILIYYREKLGMDDIVFVDINRPILSRKKVEKIVVELKKLGIDSVKTSVFVNNYTILKYFPDEYDNIDVLSYLCFEDVYESRTEKLERFFKMVEKN